MKFMELIKKESYLLCELRARLQEETGQIFDIFFEEKDGEYSAKFVPIKKEKKSLSDKVTDQTDERIGSCYIGEDVKEAINEFVTELYTEGVGKIGDDKKINKVAKKVFGDRLT